MHFEESPATLKENSYNYRVEWDDRDSLAPDISHGIHFIHYGSGSQTFLHDYDNAYEWYENLCKNVNVKGQRLIRINPEDNTEIVWMEKYHR